MMLRLLIFLFLVVNGCLATYTPYHVYLTLTGEASELQLTFTMTSNPPSATITYYNSADPSHKYVLPCPAAYSFETPYHRHEYITSVTLTDLEPDVIYVYSIAAEKTGSAEAKYSFKTLPATTKPINIALYGDLGYEGEILMTKDAGGLNSWVSRHLMDFIVHYGDLAYNLAGKDGTVGDWFMKNLMNVSTHLPYVTTPGNHEYAEESEAIYRGWFKGQELLGERSGSQDPIMWHSYDIGDFLHMVGINTEVYCEDTKYIADQMAWLAKDLATVRKRSVQPWIVVYGHRQMYDGEHNSWHSEMMRYGLQCTDSTRQSCSFKPCTSGKNCEYSLEKIFTDYKIDMYFAGHMHAYSRMLPIAPGLKMETQDHNVHINPQHPVYILSGAAGLESIIHKKRADKAGAIHGQHHHHGGEINMPTIMKAGNGGASVYFNSANHSFTAMTVFNSTHLYMKQVMVNDHTMDSLWIIKDSKKPKWTKTADFKIGTVAKPGACDQ